MISTEIKTEKIFEVLYNLYSIQSDDILSIVRNNWNNTKYMVLTKGNILSHYYIQFDPKFHFDYLESYDTVDITTDNYIILYDKLLRYKVYDTQILRVYENHFQCLVYDRLYLIEKENIKHKIDNTEQNLKLI